MREQRAAVHAEPSVYLTGRVMMKGPWHIDYTHVIASYLCCFTGREVWPVYINQGLWAAAHIAVGSGGIGSRELMAA